MQPLYIRQAILKYLKLAKLKKLCLASLTKHQNKKYNEKTQQQIYLILLLLLFGC